MSSPGSKVVVTQLVVDASGAKTGVEQFEAAISKARQAANDAGTAMGSYDSVMKRWTKSLADADPVIKAQIAQQAAMNRQLAINEQAVRLGIATQAQADQQLEKLRQKHLQLVDAASRHVAANDNLGAGFGRLGAAASSAAGMVASLGVAVSAGALVQLGRHVLDVTADLQEQADQILGSGGNVEALQAIHGVFLTNGIAIADGDKLLQRLTRTLGEAAQGSGGAQAAFRTLHLGAAQLAGTSADAALPMVVKGLLNIKDASARAAAETAIFGRSGQQLESALVALNQPMGDIIAQGKAMGLVMDQQLIQKADEAKDRMATAFAQLQVAIAPVVVDWAGKFADFAEGIGKSSTAISDLTKNIGVMVAAWGGAKLGSVFGPWGAVIGAVGGGGVAWAATHQKEVGNFFGNLGLSAEGYDITPKPAPFHMQAMGVEVATVTAYRDSAPGWKVSKEDLATAEKLKQTHIDIQAVDERIKKAVQEEVGLSIRADEVRQKYLQHQEAIKEATADYIDRLGMEVEFAGITTDQRERQAAVLEAMRISEGHLTDEQRRQIEGLVELRQETERWRDVADSIATPCDEYPAGLVEGAAGEIQEKLQEIFA